MKEIVKEIEVKKGMGVIMRKEGEKRKKEEVKREYEYMMRMWEKVRKMKMK